jgi:hypothetical protein
LIRSSSFVELPVCIRHNRWRGLIGNIPTGSENDEEKERS